MSINILDKEWDISKVKNKVPVRFLKSKGIKFNNKSSYYVIPDTWNNHLFRGKFFTKNELPSWDARKLHDIDETSLCIFLSTFWEEAQSLMDTPTEEILELYNNMLKGTISLTEMSLISMYNTKDIFTICKDNIEKDLNLDFNDFYNKYNNNYIIKIGKMHSYRSTMTADYRKRFNSVEMQWNLIPYAESTSIWDCMDEFYNVLTRYSDIHDVAGVNKYNSILKKVNVKDTIDNIKDLLLDYNLGSNIARHCILSFCISLLTEYKIKYGINPPSRKIMYGSTDHTTNVLIFTIKAIIEVKALEKNPDKIEELLLLQEKVEIFLSIIVSDKLPSYWDIDTFVSAIKNSKAKDMVIYHLFK